jgi:REP-associated tyrosine transposase
MKPRIDHRKRVRHYNNPGDCHELTFSCYQRLPLLTNDKWRQMLSESIDRATERYRYRYRLAAFIFMPEHVHLLVYPDAGAANIDRLLQAIKRPYSFRIKQLLIERQSPLLKKLTIRQRPGVMTFRYWQEGPGYDRNLYEPKSVIAAIDYIHLNPVRRGLCAQPIDWRWSSALRFYDPSRPLDPMLPTIHPLPAEFLIEIGGG